MNNTINPHIRPLDRSNREEVAIVDRLRVDAYKNARWASFPNGFPDDLRCQDDPPGTWVVVQTIDDRIVGTVCLKFARTYEEFLRFSEVTLPNEHETALIAGRAAIDPAWQKHGLYLAMREYILRLAQQANAAVQMGIMPMGNPIIKNLETLGYKRRFVGEGAFKCTGEHAAVFLMATCYDSALKKLLAGDAGIFPRCTWNPQEMPFWAQEPSDVSTI